MPDRNFFGLCLIAGTSIISASERSISAEAISTETFVQGIAGFQLLAIDEPMCVAWNGVAVIVKISKKLKSSVLQSFEPSSFSW